jgi:hypothetical protein
METQMCNAGGQQGARIPGQNSLKYCAIKTGRNSTQEKTEARTEEAGFSS